MNAIIRGSLTFHARKAEASMIEKAL